MGPGLPGDALPASKHQAGGVIPAPWRPQRARWALCHPVTLQLGPHWATRGYPEETAAFWSSNMICGESKSRSSWAGGPTTAPPGTAPALPVCPSGSAAAIPAPRAPAGPVGQPPPQNVGLSFPGSAIIPLVASSAGGAVGVWWPQSPPPTNAGLRYLKCCCASRRSAPLPGREGRQ